MREGHYQNLLQTIDTVDLPFGSDFFQVLFDCLYDGVYFVDTQRKILFWNKAAERMTGYSAEEVVGHYCYEGILSHENNEGTILCNCKCPLQESIDTNNPATARVYLRHKKGYKMAVDVNIMPVLDNYGSVIGGVEIFRDASSYVALESAYDGMKRLAEMDPLTNVANRRSLDALLEEQLAVLKKTNIPFSVILADIDHFKLVNDQWGHVVGDEVLVHFADHLKNLCRSSDLVARYGGEEFMLLLPEQKIDQALILAKRLCNELGQISVASMNGQSITSSFGVAQGRQTDLPADLFNRVDQALYRAKEAGRNRVEAELS